MTTANQPRFDLTGKLSGNGASNRSVHFVGNEDELNAYKLEVYQAGYTLSGVIERPVGEVKK